LTPLIIAFIGCYFVLQVADWLTDMGKDLWGIHSTFVKVNVSFYVASAFLIRETWSAVPRSVGLGILVGLGVADTVWAGVIARRDMAGGRIKKAGQ
jgi:hypothetical protein